MSTVTLSHEELEEMLDRAARRGAKEALRSIGMLDDNAQKDIVEIRGLLEAWRDTRKSFWMTVVRVSTAALLAFMAGAVWMTLDR